MGAVEALAAPSRAQLQRFQESLHELPRADMDLSHLYGPGFYARTLQMPAGTVAVGKVHATEHIFLLTKGEITVVTEDGSQTLRAPHQAVCRAGLKRAVYCHTDVTCTNVHITTETDLAKLEAALIEPEGLIEHEVTK